MHRHSSRQGGNCIKAVKGLLCWAMGKHSMMLAWLCCSPKRHCGQQKRRQRLHTPAYVRYTDHERHKAARKLLLQGLATSLST